MKIKSALFIFKKKSNTQVLNLLLITSEEKLHYVFIKDFDRLMYSKEKTKDSHKNCFCRLLCKIIVCRW